MVVKLIVLRGNTSIKEIALKDAKTIVGRQRNCKLRIPSSLVSRTHCELSIHDDVLTVRDLGSSNGTLVNGSKVREKRLAPGDTLGIGPLTFLIQINGDDGSGAGEDFILIDESDETMEMTDIPARKEVAALDFAPDLDEDVELVFVAEDEEGPAGESPEEPAVAEILPGNPTADFVVDADLSGDDRGLGAVDQKEELEVQFISADVDAGDEDEVVEFVLEDEPSDGFFVIEDDDEREK